MSRVLNEVEDLYDPIYYDGWDHTIEKENLLDELDCLMLLELGDKYYEEVKTFQCDKAYEAYCKGTEYGKKMELIDAMEGIHEFLEELLVGFDTTWTLEELTEMHQEALKLKNLGEEILKRAEEEDEEEEDF